MRWWQMDRPLCGNNTNGALMLSARPPKTWLLSATVTSANWNIGDQNYYRQFAELSRKNQSLLKLKKQFADELQKCSSMGYEA